MGSWGGGIASQCFLSARGRYRGVIAAMLSQIAVEWVTKSWSSSLSFSFFLPTGKRGKSRGLYGIKVGVRMP